MTPRQKFVATLLGMLAGSVAAAGTLAVTAAGFALSFDAIRATGQAAHIRPSLTWLLPVAIDGAMSVAAVCAVVLRRMGRSSWYPWMVVIVGAGISIACNALHAYQEGGEVPLPPEWAMAISAVPAVLLALSVHLLVILAEAVRRAGEPGAPTEPETEAEPVRAPAKRAPGGKRSAAEKVANARERAPRATQQEIAKRTKVSARTVARYWHANGPDTAPASEPNSRPHDGVPELAEVGADV